MIQLRPVAITELAQRYARDMGNNKVRHYRVSHMAMLINKFTGKSAEDVVREYLKDTENEDVEFLDKETGEIFKGFDELQLRISKKNG